MVGKVLLLLLLVLCVEDIAGQTFQETPQNASVPIGRNATFMCSAMEEYSDVNWIIVIDDRLYDPHVFLADNEALREKGITIEPEVTSPSNNRSLTVPATEENNGTEVRCRLLPSGLIKGATLTVLGPPLPPEIKWKSTKHTILISWEPPFTWPDYPIQHYTVTVQDEQNSGSDQHNQTGLIYEFNPNGAQSQVCAMYSFSVTATSDIGEGGAGRVEGGFIVGHLDNSSIQLSLTNQGSLSPTLTIEIDFPEECDDVDPTAVEYQYTAMLQHVDSSGLELIWNQTEEYVPGSTVEIVVNSADLVINNTYILSMTITGTTDAGSAETYLDLRFTTVDCGALMNPNNGQVNFTDTTTGANATYTCDEGFTLEGVDTRTCEADGQWSDSEPTCESAGGAEMAQVSLLVMTLLAMVGLAIMGL